MNADDPELRREWRRVPPPSRVHGTDAVRTEILRRHDGALDSGSPTYIDPVSGFSVFTSVFLATRGYCCDSGCRHCPFIV